MLLAAAFLLLATPDTAVAQGIEQADLRRCEVSSAVPCISAFASGVRSLTSTTPDSALARAWRARFRGDTAVAGIGQRAMGRGTLPPARVLVLVDVSGSMKSDFRFAYTLSALRFFLRQLDSLPRGGVRVSVAAFGSRNVRQGVEAASFVPADSARAQVDGIRAPDRENTGLYSAIRTGVDRLDAELGTAGDGATGHLVVITDGNNEVRPGDDSDLLDGQGGLATAATAVNESRSIVTILGIGNLNRPALETLAGERGRVVLLTDAQFKVGRELTAIRDLLASTWEVVFPMSDNRAELGRGFAVLRPRLGDQASAGSNAVAWVPPLVALPAFVGTVPAGVVDASLAAASSFEVSWIVTAVMLAIVAVLWLVLPARLWPAPAGVAAPAAPKPAKVAKDPGGLRADVKEAPPRKPTDITASRARPA